MIIPLNQLKSNQCGDCTLCCKLLGVVELDKPVDKYCQYAVSKQGCKIYETRPDSCRAFTCLWLKGMSKDFKPNKIHGVLSVTNDGDNLVLYEDPGYPGHARNALLPILHEFAKDGKHFVIVRNGKERKIFARPDLKKRIEYKSDDEIIVHDVVEELHWTLQDEVK